MKKIILYTILICFSFSGFSQKLKVRNMRKLNIEEKAWFPVFGNDKREILFSGQNYKGLSIYQTKKNKLEILSSSEKAGSDIEIDPAGNILFKESQLQDGKKSIQYYKYNPESKVKTLINKDQIPRTKKAIVDGKEIKIIQGDKEIISFAPVEGRYYLWTSISPDGKKILFTAAGDGSYISDLNGNILTKLGYLNAPEWINNEWVVGMDDKDNGEIVISSDIIAVHIGSEKSFNLTEKLDAIAQYPKSSPEGKKIVFHSPEGEIYLMKIKTK